METETILAHAGAMFAAATLYASVGHAGASAYLGIMALAGVAPEASRPMLSRANATVLAIAGAKMIFL